MIKAIFLTTLFVVFSCKQNAASKVQNFPQPAGSSDTQTCASEQTFKQKIQSLVSEANATLSQNDQLENAQQNQEQEISTMDSFSLSDSEIPKIFQEDFQRLDAAIESLKQKIASNNPVAIPFGANETLKKLEKSRGELLYHIKLCSNSENKASNSQVGFIVRCFGGENLQKYVGEYCSKADRLITRDALLPKCLEKSKEARAAEPLYDTLDVSGLRVKTPCAKPE